MYASLNATLKIQADCKNFHRFVVAESQIWRNLCVHNDNIFGSREGCGEHGQQLTPNANKIYRLF
ncbi:hypothetical protein A2U01_0087088, partial [Trifolium medium]|nr:hypothetical protein [Trifolium medium]